MKLAAKDNPSGLASVEAILADAAAGRMFILVDDEDRENEGDLIIPAEKADADAINFMAKYGRGLICLALTRERVETLRLPLMARHNQSRHETAFTVSIEAREGISTGISAADRARTIAVAIDAGSNATDIVSPGHVFPLVAKDGGVLVRAGHTEAAVDIARMAGLTPAGVICEVMNDDGSMARLPDLLVFAKAHGLNVGSIADLIAYRRRSEKLVSKVAETPFVSRYGGEFSLKLYSTFVPGAEHVVLVKGDISGNEPVLVRMHALDVLHDVLGESNHPKSGELHSAMKLVGEKGRGVIVILRNNTPEVISERLKREAHPTGAPGSNLRDYGIGAQILLDLGIRDMLLLSNSKRQIIGLDGYGLNVVGYETIPPLERA